MSSLLVESPGLLTSVQDLGRKVFRLPERRTLSHCDWEICWSTTSLARRGWN